MEPMTKIRNSHAIIETCMGNETKEKGRNQKKPIWKLSVLKKSSKLSSKKRRRKTATLQITNPMGVTTEKAPVDDTGVAYKIAPKRRFSFSLKRSSKLSKSDSEELSSISPDKAYAIVLQCTFWIRKNGMRYPGIFRKASSKFDFESVQSKLLEIDPKNFFCDENLRTTQLDEILEDFVDPIPIVADILKKTIRNMSPTLLDSFSISAFLTYSSSEDTDFAIINGLVDRIPNPRQKLFISLIVFLADLSQYEEDNRMGLSNLSMVFGPSLFDWETLRAQNFAISGVATYLQPILECARQLFGKRDDMYKIIREMIVQDESLSKNHSVYLRSTPSRFLLHCLDISGADKITPLKNNLLKSQNRLTVIRSQTSLGSMHSFTSQSNLQIKLLDSRAINITGNLIDEKDVKTQKKISKPHTLKIPLSPLSKSESDVLPPMLSKS